MTYYVNSNYETNYFKGWKGTVCYNGSLSERDGQADKKDRAQGKGGGVMRRPITSIEKALEIYYNHTMLGNKEIKELFGVTSDCTARVIKNEVNKAAAERDMLPMGNNYVETDFAYEVWGIDVANLEKRLAKKRKFEVSA